MPHFPDFLPTTANNLTESASIALAHNIRRTDIITPLSPQPNAQNVRRVSIASGYVCEGAGSPPILLLHGFDSSVLEFRRILPLLAPHRQTYALDLLGFGFTDRMAGTPFDPTAIKTHLHSFWKTIIGEPVILVGVSMGGAAAIDFTTTYPHAVKQLVLINSAGFAKDPLLAKFMPSPLLYMATEFLRNPQVRQNAGIRAYKDPKFASTDACLCADMHLQMAGWNQAMMAFTKSGGYSFLSAEFISKIDKKTLTLWGDSDKILGTAYAKKFAAAIPDNQLIWIDDCGHVPHLEKPEITAQYILDFIGN